MEGNAFVLTVTQLNSYLNSLFHSDTLLKKAAIHGEVVNLNKKYNTIFLSLKDSDSLIDCIVSESSLIGNIGDLEEGADIIAYGSVGVYSASGRLRLSITSFELFGDGIYFKKLEKLKKRLSAEGIFDDSHKKRLPDFPEKVALITSEKGAALRDMINVASRRNPHVSLCLYAVKVQGPTAAAELTEAVNRVASFSDIDVIIIGRGGGSLLDLDPFNDEGLVRAIYNCGIPVVSAVGHQTDFTLCDFVADLRAPTPSAAAELVVPSALDIRDYIASVKYEMTNAMTQAINLRERDIEFLCSSISDVYIKNKILACSGDIPLCKKDMYDILKEKYNAKVLELAKYASVVDAANPMNIVKNGYAIVEKDGNKITSVSSLKRDDMININLADGTVYASVTGTEERIGSKNN